MFRKFEYFSMSIQNKIEQYLSEIRELETLFSEAQVKEVIPLSFFSYAIDILCSLRTGIFEIEAIQLQMMQEHLKKPEPEWYEEKEFKEIETPPELLIKEEKVTPVINVLADTIGRKISSDFSKSLSLNDRFMFQRDLFHGNAYEMNQVFTQINEFQSLNEVLKFLNDNYSIPWSSDSGIALKELLDKRFV